jgi:hypothetical protein
MGGLQVIIGDRAIILPKKVLKNIDELFRALEAHPINMADWEEAEIKPIKNYKQMEEKNGKY